MMMMRYHMHNISHVKTVYGLVGHTQESGRRVARGTGGPREEGLDSGEGMARANEAKRE